MKHLTNFGYLAFQGYHKFVVTKLTNMSVSNHGYQHSFFAMFCERADVFSALTPSSHPPAPRVFQWDTMMARWQYQIIISGLICTQTATFLIPSEQTEKLKILSADFTNRTATYWIRVTQNKIHWWIFINLQFWQNQRTILDQIR